MRRYWWGALRGLDRFRAKAAPPVRSDSSAASYKAGTLKPRSDKRRAMGRIEHTLLDEGRKSSPTDLRPSPAPSPYHTKSQMFLSTTEILGGWGVSELG